MLALPPACLVTPHGPLQAPDKSSSFPSFSSSIAFNSRFAEPRSLLPWAKGGRVGEAQPASLGSWEATQTWP